MKKTIIVSLIIISIIIITIIIIQLNQNKYIENYQDKLLYPTKGLKKECAQEGYLPAYMPSSCIKKDGYYNSLRNCKCVDNDGYCTICYEEIEHEGLQGNNYGSPVQT